MATEIRGETADAQTQMILGQISRVFDPDWIQVLSGGRFTVQFSDDHARDELVEFADMYGFSLSGEQERTWKSYWFE